MVNSDQLPKCPRCNEPMVLRTNTHTREPFWGCPKFPECRGTRPLPVPKTDDDDNDDEDMWRDMLVS